MRTALTGRASDSHWRGGSPGASPARWRPTGPEQAAPVARPCGGIEAGTRVPELPFVRTVAVHQPDVAALEVGDRRRSPERTEARVVVRERPRRATSGGNRVDVGAVSRRSVVDDGPAVRREARGADPDPARGPGEQPDRAPRRVDDLKARRAGDEEA